MKTLHHVPFFVAIAALVMALSCCGGSPTDPETNGGDPTGEEFDLASVQSALDALLDADSLYLDVMASQDMESAAQAALALLNGNASVLKAGVGPDSTVWAFFRNGLLVTIYELERNFSGGGMPRSAPAVPRGERGGGEAVGAAVVMTPFAHEFGDASELQVAGMLDTCFGSAELGTQVFSNHDVTVEKVGQVLASGPGVLLYSSHGCIVPQDTTDAFDWVALVTGESYSSEQMATRIVTIYPGGAAAPGQNREIVVVAHKGRHYLGVTPAFIASHANFDQLEGTDYNGCKSLVYACCCYSGHPGSYLPEAFINAGVDKYCGWTNTVNPGFASNLQIEFFENATDTFNICEAWDEIDNVTDPWNGAILQPYQSPLSAPMMIRAQMLFTKDGADLHGYSVGVAIDDGVTMVSCFAGEPMQMPQFSISLHAPGTGPASWNCGGDEDALIILTEFATGQFYVVQKDFVGVDGTIDVEKYDEHTISGKFSGTLGYWTQDQNPEKDPPSTTVSIQNGHFKHVGVRQ